ncbi:MAG TPA: glutathione S-transferase N-terminal domain-containing protein [Hyphomicrobium sp.]|nr:glutathione S-transferase N-terminal domain-containing protein [Hyphomicrobium sp.]
MPNDITLYFWPTPNGQKIAIMLEELGEPYRVHYIDINAGAQHDPAYLVISPNNRIPAIVDPDGPDGNALALFESGAILQYLGRKYEQFYPTTERRKAEIDQWLFWQVGGLGPMSGQALHFRKYATEKIPYGVERYTNEVARLFSVMERRLKDRDYLALEYSIADIACFPWVRRWPDLGQNIGQFPRLKSWFDRIAARPAVMRGLQLGADPALRVNA